MQALMGSARILGAAFGICRKFLEEHLLEAD